MGGSSNLLYPGVPFQKNPSKTPPCISLGRGARGPARRGGPMAGRLKDESHERGGLPQRQSWENSVDVYGSMVRTLHDVQQVVACIREVDYIVALTLSSSLEVLWEKEEKAIRRGRKTPTLSDILTVIPGTLKTMMDLTLRLMQPYNIGACTHMKENILSREGRVVTKKGGANDIQTQTAT